MGTTTENERDVFAASSESNAAASLPAWAVTCLNCGTTLAGPYCSHCGQHAAPSHATLKELSGEAFSEFSGWDGKLVKTLKLLFLEPGELTRQFLNGQRARFISPLRLYLSASVLFFVLAGRPPRAPAVPKRPPTAAEAAKAAKLQERNQQLLDQIDLSPPILQPLIRKIATDEKAFTADVFDSLGKAVFAMLPVFAAILMLFYRKRHFAEHLYFSIHLHAFMFAVADAALLIGYLRQPMLAIPVAIAASLWIPVYTHLALVRVYGGKQGDTLAKELGISVLYTAALVPVIVTLAIWVAWRGA